MDYSKLPKFSQTSVPPTTDADAEPPIANTAHPQSQAPHYSQNEPGMAAEIWISAVIGLVMLMMGWNFARFLGATLTGQTFHTNVTWETDDARGGQEVRYFELQGYTAWTESGLFLFGVALLIEAAALAVARRPSKLQKSLIVVALILSVLATVYNLIAAGLVFSIGLLPIVSVLVVAFGGYMAMFQYKLLKTISPPARPFT